ncbi:MAG TPA: GNAT family protein [Polyangia bacterium]|jgi:RimJ/RimL family protein N-acetyltransferase|nr:GNAT family protein [Polyangia bacterium]
MTPTVLTPDAALRFEGRHVRLEPLGLAHVPALLEIARRGAEAFAFTFVPSDEASATAYVTHALAERDAGRAVPFATCDAATGHVVGTTRFLNIERWSWPVGSALQRAPGRPDVVEIGATWLAPEAQRTGINTEAKLLMLTHAFERWQVHRVSLVTDARNARCRAAILRLGARFDGVLRAARPAADGTIRDTAAYSIVAAEWPSVASRLRARLR